MLGFKHSNKHEQARYTIFIDKKEKNQCNFSHTIIVFSQDDVALIIKYEYHEEANLKKTKKQKKEDNASIIQNYSITLLDKIDLPAVAFIEYLETDMKPFLNDCIRYYKKSTFPVLK